MGEYRASAAGEHELATGETAAGGRLVQDWKDAHERALAYLAALGLPDEERIEISLVAVQEASARPWTPPSNAVAATLEEVRRRLAGDDGGRQAFVRWRLVRAFGTGAEAGLAATPPLRRTPMGYELIRRRAGDGRSRRRGGTGSAAESVLYGRPLRRLRRSLAWTRAAHRRRLLLVLLVLVPTTVASGVHGERAAAPGAEPGSRWRSSPSSARSSAGSRSASGPRCSASSRSRAAATASRSPSLPRAIRRGRRARRRPTRTRCRTAIIMPICQRAGGPRVRRPAGHLPRRSSAPAPSSTSTSSC